MLSKVRELPSAVAHYSLGSVVVMTTLMAYGIRRRKLQAAA